MSKIKRIGDEKELILINNFTKINKKEIIAAVEDHNIFVLAKAMGYFIPHSDSLIFYLFAKKILKAKIDSAHPTDQDDELLEVIMEGIKSNEFLNI